MKRVHFMTLADVRRIDTAAFDAAIKLAFKQAAEDVGEQVVIYALCKPQQFHNKEIRQAA